MGKYYDRGKQTAPELNPGDWVLLNAKNCHEYGRYKYSGPGNMDVTIVFESWITIQD